jgi:nitrate/nitrite transporter NarK
MNTAGQIGGILSPIVPAYVVDRVGDWSLPLHILSVLYAMAAVAWLLVRPAEAACHN